MPPVLFGTEWFAALDKLSGDQGARALLDRAEIVEAAMDDLFDIDCPEDLDAAQARVIMS
jgi:CTP:molybdopterin cytidylyltransferase MocA